MGTPAHHHLSSLAHHARAVTRAAEELTRGLSEEQLLWRPAPDTWGIADCLEHLMAVGDAYYPRVREALEEGTEAEPDHEYRPRLFGRLFIFSAGPEGKLPVRARGPFIPPPAGPDAPARFVQHQEQLLELLGDAGGVDLNRNRITSPLMRFLVLTLGECLEMLVRHQERHLAQARRVQEAEGFPTG